MEIRFFFQAENTVMQWRLEGAEKYTYMQGEGRSRDPLRGWGAVETL